VWSIGGGDLDFDGHAEVVGRKPGPGAVQHFSTRLQRKYRSDPGKRPAQPEGILVAAFRDPGGGDGHINAGAVSPAISPCRTTR
jgi:hypothetical protein